jgi:hypothetical protein
MPMAARFHSSNGSHSRLRFDLFGTEKAAGMNREQVLLSRPRGVIDRVLGEFVAADVIRDSRSSRDAPRLDVENLARRTDVAECHRVSAGQPDLCAKPGQFVEQRGAPAGIEMGDNLVEQ